jgi:hypothetical protein
MSGLRHRHYRGSRNDTAGDRHLYRMAGEDARNPLAKVHSTSDNPRDRARMR